VGRYTPTGGTCAAVLAGRLDNSSCLTWDQVTHGSANSPYASTQSNDGRRTLSQPVNQLHNRDTGVTLNIDYTMDFATLTSITAYDHFKFGLTDDFAAAVSDMLIQTETTDINYVSQELRLTSPSGGRFSWIAGANYAHDSFDDYRLNDISDNAIILTRFGLTPASGFLDNGYRQTTEYWGVFGQADYKLTDQFSVTGAVRYSNETKQYRDGSLSFPVANLTVYGPLDADYHLEDHVSGKVGFQYQPNRDAMIYGTISKGYRSGGFYGGFISATTNVLPFKEEVIWSYELGAKTEWFDRRLTANGAVFYYDHRDAQGFATVPSPLLPNAYIYNLTNIGDARHVGAEFELTGRPMEGLRIQGGIAYVDAKITDSDLSFTGLDGTPVAFEGNRLDYAPKWSGSAAIDYEAAVSSGVTAGVHLDYNFRTQVTFKQTLVDQALSEIKGYDLATARIFARLPNGWGAAVFVRNLFDETYAVSRIGDGLGSYQETFGDPRRFGFEISKSW
jgi:iron complex outermembrane receptor protein